MKKDFCMTPHGSVVVTDTEAAGRPVMLIHGNSLSSECYEPQLNGEPGRRWRLIAFDLPGHGESPRAADPARTYGLATYAQIVREVSELLGLSRPVLVGHSLGGHIAMQAVGAGLAVDGLFVFGSPPFHEPPDFSAAFLPGVTRGPMFRAQPAQEEIDRQVGVFMPPGVHPPEYYARSFAATDPAAREWLARDVREEHHHDECRVVTALGPRAAIVHGEYDRVVSLPYIQSLGLTACWRGRVQIIRGAGHCPEHDAPDEFNRLLQEFLTALPS